MPPYKLLSRKADTVGDGSGSKSGVVNASPAAPVTLRIQAQGGEVIHVERVIVSVQDGTINSYDIYAGAGQLTNGIRLWVEDYNGTVQYHLTDPDDPVINLGEWGHHCYDASIKPTQTAGDDHFVVRWTFGRHGKAVHLLPGWSVCVLLQDNLSALSEHNFLFQGYFLQPTIGDGRTGQGHQ